jgi:hypothetical protein
MTNGFSCRSWAIDLKIDSTFSLYGIVFSFAEGDCELGFFGQFSAVPRAGNLRILDRMRPNGPDSFVRQFVPGILDAQNMVAGSPLPGGDVEFLAAFFVNGFPVCRLWAVRVAVFSA